MCFVFDVILIGIGAPKLLARLNIIAMLVLEIYEWYTTPKQSKGGSRARRWFCARECTTPVAGCIMRYVWAVGTNDEPVF